jgi:hypothetical protein
MWKLVAHTSVSWAVYLLKSVDKFYEHDFHFQNFYPLPPPPTTTPLGWQPWTATTAAVCCWYASLTYSKILRARSPQSKQQVKW